MSGVQTGALLCFISLSIAGLIGTFYFDNQNAGSLQKITEMKSDLNNATWNYNVTRDQVASLQQEVSTLTSSNRVLTTTVTQLQQSLENASWYGYEASWVLNNFSQGLSYQSESLTQLVFAYQFLQTAFNSTNKTEILTNALYSEVACSGLFSEAYQNFIHAYSYTRFNTSFLVPYINQTILQGNMSYELQATARLLGEYTNTEVNSTRTLMWIHYARFNATRDNFYTIGEW